MRFLPLIALIYSSVQVIPRRSEMRKHSMKSLTLVVAMAACALFSYSSRAAAQMAPGAMPPRINQQQRNLPNSVVLRGESHATTMQRLRVVHQYALSDVRSNGRVTLGTTKLNFAPLLNNPKALFNVAQKLRTLPQQVQVSSDQTEMSEVEQGLIIHHVLGFRVLPGKCNDPSVRAQLQNAGVSCFQSESVAARVQGFSIPGNPRYVADPGKRQRAISAYQDKAKQQATETSAHIADLRRQLADPSKRGQFVSAFGAAEVDRVSRLNDDQLKAELINSGEQRIEQTMFIPKLDSVARTPAIGSMRIVPNAQEIARQRQLLASPTSTSPGLTARPMQQGGMVGLNPATAATTIAADHFNNKDLGTFIFLTGFTLGRDYEWSQSVSTTIKWCWVGCASTYSVDLYAGFSYGFGLRFPIQTHLDYKYTLHPDNSDLATVKVDYAPINGSPAQYAAAGLGGDQIFEGKELVAQVLADAGINYSLPIVGSGNVGITIGKDFTQGLPAPFTNGQFTPPAPCGHAAPCPEDLDAAPIIFDNFDLLGGEGNFGVVGGQLFPAVKVGLHSDSLRFTLYDYVNGRQTQTIIANSGRLTPISVANEPTRSSHFSLANPVYNLGFVVTPGVDARLFIDLDVWSDHWDWPIWFPALTIELPPGGVDFGCHANTVCSRNFDVKGREFSVVTGIKTMAPATARDQLLKDVTSTGCQDKAGSNANHTVVCPTAQTLATCKSKAQGRNDIACILGK